MRRQHDAYYTPKWMVDTLIDYAWMGGSWAEPCVGDGAIVKAIPGPPTWTNDVDRKVKANFHYDASKPELWADRPSVADWVITNPPYTMPVCQDIVERAYEFAYIGVAMLLRLSYLEPTKRRGEWLSDHPPSQVIVMPRYSFTQDGGKDNVTTCWCVWRKDDYKPANRIIISTYKG